MNNRELFNGFVSICTLLTLLIVILDYLGFGKEFWKVKDPASAYSDSPASQDASYTVIDKVVKEMELSQEQREILGEGEKLMLSIQFHIDENSRYALNELKPQVRYYSNGLGVLFYTSHEFRFEGKERCKRLTIEWPESLKALKPLGTQTYCLTDGEWSEVVPAS